MQNLQRRPPETEEENIILASPRFLMLDYGVPYYANSCHTHTLSLSLSGRHPRSAGRKGKPAATFVRDSSKVTALRSEWMRRGEVAVDWARARKEVLKATVGR